MVSDRKRSSVWNYFTVSVCGQCQENVARGGDQTNSFTTSNLCKHLKVWHPDKFKELEKTEKATKKPAKTVPRINLPLQ